MPNLTYTAPSGELGAYLAMPRSGGPWPGVVVIMDALGLSNDIREQADRLAAAGFIALAPDLYSGRGLRCIVACLQASRSGEGAAYPDLQAARDWLAAREDCTGKIGAIGFCMGGGFALQLAPRGAYAAVSANYGELPRPAEEVLAGSCPVVASYGAKDRTLPGRAARLESALTAAGVAHDVKEYPDTAHSFMNRINTGPGISFIQNFVGFGYHHPSAEDSWTRILRFFDEHLAG